MGQAEDTQSLSSFLSLDTSPDDASWLAAFVVSSITSHTCLCWPKIVNAQSVQCNRLPSLRAGLVCIYSFTLYFPNQNSLILFPSFIEPSHSPLLNGMTLLYIPHNSLESCLLLLSIFAMHYLHLGLPSHPYGQRLDNKLHLCLLFCVSLSTIIASPWCSKGAQTMLLIEHPETFSLYYQKLSFEKFHIILFLCISFGGWGAKKISGFPAWFESDRINAEAEI